MKEVFSLSYPLSGYPNAEATFAVTESEDGAIGVTAGTGAWVRIPVQAFELLHNFLRQQIEAINHVASERFEPFVSSEVETQRATVPADVARLVIAAREVWEDATDEDALIALEKALEAFSERVPYANEPEPGTCAVSGKPIGPDDWQCGDQRLRASLALALVVREPKLIGDPAFQRVVEDLAYEAGKRATTLALSRLMPGALLEDEIPF